MSDLFTSSQNGASTATDEGFVGMFDPSLKASEISQRVDWIVTQRRGEHVQDLLSLSSHKSVQVRRKVAAGLGKIGKEDILNALQQWQLHESDRETWVLLESTIDRIRRGLTGENLEQDVAVLSVTEAVKYLKTLISEKTFVIEGEMSEVRLFQRPGQDIYYLGLKDSQDSRIDCMLLSRIAYRAGFAINEGMMVRATGKFKLGKQSRIYFDIQKLSLTGEGELLRNLKLLEEKLQKEGLFDVSRKRSIPLLPRRVLLLASPNSAAVNDYLKVLGARRRGVEIYHLPIKTQGVGAEFDILSQLEMVNELNDKHNIDLVVITRGGGSQDDLFVFNSEKIVRALHGINRPVIAAIGHERDVSLAELVADLRCSTPSQAAEKSSLSTEQVTHQTSALYSTIQGIIHDKRHRYHRVSNQLYTNISLLFKRELEQVKAVCAQVDSLAAHIIYSTRHQVQYTVSTVHDLVRRHMMDARVKVVDVRFLTQLCRVETKEYRNSLQRILYEVKNESLEQLKTTKIQLELVSCHLELSDPKKVLEKGYAMVTKGDKVVERAGELEPRDVVTLQFQDGAATLEVLPL